MFEKLAPGRLVRRFRRSISQHRMEIAAWAAVAVLAVLAALQILPEPSEERVPDTVDSVVVIGVGGLTWTDIDAESMPNLSALAETGSLAELNTDSGRDFTCTFDGWLTLSAGAPAVASSYGDTSDCGAVTSDQITDAGSGATVDDMTELVELNRELDQGTELGMLAAGTECATAIGPGAAYATANSVGRVTEYNSAFPTDELGGTLGECPLTVIGGGVLADDETVRRADLEALDATIGAVQEARGESSAVIVTGLGQTTAPNRLLAAVANFGDEDGHNLLDLPAERPGYLRLTDVTATILTLLDAPLPDSVAGAAAGATDDTLDYEARQAVFDDTDTRLIAADVAAPNTQWLQVLLFLALTFVAWPLLHLLRRAGQPGVKPPPLWLMRLNIISALVCALFVAAGILADFFPWWNTARPGIVGPATALSIAVVCAVVAVFLPRRHGAAGLLVTVSAFGIAVTILAMIVHSQAPLGTLLGDYTVADSASGELGPVATGMFIASMWLLAAAAAWRLPRRFQSPVMAGIGCLGVLVVSAGFLGDSVPAAVGLTVGTCLAAALATGGWVTFSRFVWSGLAGAAVLLGLSWIDYQRPAAERGELGAFWADLLGDTNGVIGAGVSSNIVAAFTSPLSVLTIMAGLYCWLILLRPGGGLRRAYGLYSPLRAAVVAAVVGSAVAGLLLGKGLMSLGSALAVIVPLAIIVSHRVLARAHVKDGEYSDMIVDAPSWVDEAYGGESVSVESRG
ncbi:alkaline phosphatase family protein [Glycomyces buryatensis]|uniref:Alkaline phosphatase family protein n=1 Tax=Glycomyces buryatensis TaxID=2570927 RepID=A0A4V4HSD6_9ACTN|nr:alkaline phosphatase family protein [Glycomyces buryatensis]THV41366.1 alkaline phosphatase family protein [Glycomyces buryatensis]